MRRQRSLSPTATKQQQQFLIEGFSSLSLPQSNTTSPQKTAHRQPRDIFLNSSSSSSSAAVSCSSSALNTTTTTTAVTPAFRRHDEHEKEPSTCSNIVETRQRSSNNNDNNKNTTINTTKNCCSSSSSLLLHPITEMKETFSNPRFLAEGGYGRVVSALDIQSQNNVAVKIMNFTCSTEDASRLQGLAAFGDLANLLPGQDYIPSHIAGELRTHDALRDVKGTMPLLRVEIFCDQSTVTKRRNTVYNFDEEVLECFVMLVLPMLTPLNSRYFSNTRRTTTTTTGNNNAIQNQQLLMKTAKSLGRTLREMHLRGWLHRDLSVTNTFISQASSSSEEQEVFIGDFGLAICSLGRCSTASRFFAMETNFCTTIWYRSPEIVSNPDLPYTFSNDCWSLGALIAELLFCRPLFPGMDRESQLAEMKENLGTQGQKAEEFWASLRFPSSSSEQDDVIMKALFKSVCDHLLNFDPAKRSVQKFLDSLEK